ncbi:glycosyltransferase family 4 protein [Massilia jejuensis]|uniref:Glycosyltransferase family 4 protein n=1 Tax=Massilia jejuensis TaxID=648894 RepID=A0ABW0PH35_9BURK
MTRRVLHVITGLEVGGAEMALYRLILEFRNSQYAHTVIALSPGGGLESRFIESGIALTVLDVRRSPVAGLFKLWWLVRTLRPDIVQTWLYHADFLGGLAARLAGNRNVIWGVRTTDVDGGCARATSFIRRACASLSRWVPHTIVCVAEAARQSHSVLGYDPGRMVVIGNGFDLATLSANDVLRQTLRTECGFGKEDVVVGTLGRFNLDKDHENFVQAAGQLARRHARLRFLMVGKDLDADNDQLMRWIGATGYAHRFVLLGERPDAAVCLAAMDIFCLSSRTEGFPNAVGEAMAMGLPCVATDVGDVAALMADTGVLVPKANPAALARGVAKLMTFGTHYRQQLGRQAQERIRETFTMACVRQRFESIYENVIAKGKR